MDIIELHNYSTDEAIVPLYHLLGKNDLVAGEMALNLGLLLKETAKSILRLFLKIAKLSKDWEFIQYVKCFFLLFFK